MPKRDRLNLFRSSRVADDAYARMALRQTEEHPTNPHPFIAACRAVQVEPTAGEAKLWRAGRGLPLRIAWSRHPKSRHLPALHPPADAASASADVTRSFSLRQNA